MYEAVQAALARHRKITADYVYDSSRLQADTSLYNFAEKWMKDHAPKPEISDDEYFALLRDGKGRSSAARELGLDPVLIHRRLQTDDEFRERVVVAEYESLEPAYQELRRMAEGGDLKAINKLLESKNSAEFAQSPKTQLNVQINGANGRHSDDPIDNQIFMLEADLSEKRALLSGDVIDIPFEDTDE